jgi:hypothetical protein
VEINQLENVESLKIPGLFRLSDKQLGRIARNPSFMADYNHLVSSTVIPPTSPAVQDTKVWKFEMINRLEKGASAFQKRPIIEHLEY